MMKTSIMKIIIFIFFISSTLAHTSPYSSEISITNNTNTVTNIFSSYKKRHYSSTGTFSWPYKPHPQFGERFIRPTPTQKINDYCESEVDKNLISPQGNPLTWPETPAGSYAYPSENCLNSSMEPVIRLCNENGILTDNKPKWDEPTGKSCINESMSESTIELSNLSRTQITSRNVEDITNKLANIINKAEIPSAADVKLVANSLQQISEVANSITSKSIGDLANLMDGVLKSSDISNNDQESIKNDKNATKTILNAFDTILSKMKIEEESGVARAFSKKAGLLVSDISRSNVKEIRITLNDIDNGIIESIQPIKNNNNENDDIKIISKYDISAKLLDENLSGRASFVLINSNRTFIQNKVSQTLNSQVIGVTVTEDNKKNNKHNIRYEIKPFVSNQSERHCAFWDLEHNEWSTEGCKLIEILNENGNDVCECTHLTHFGEIIGVGGESIALDVISIIGCFLSLLGIIAIFLTAIIFKQWRSRLGNKILLNLSGAIGLTMIAFLAIAFGGSAGGTGDGGCIFLGVLLHYSVLSSFCWMFVSAVLQFLRFVLVLSSRTPHFLLKGVIFGWCLPLIPVIALLAVGPSKTYIANVSEDGSGKFCYPSEGIALILGVIVPVTLIVLANLTCFIIIVYRVTCGRDQTLRTNINALSERRMAMRQLRMSILLFFLLGLSWIFGLLALLLPNVQAWRIIFSYLFCITATLQGFALFLFFILWERNARDLWLNRLPVSLRPVVTTTESGITPSTASTSNNTRTDDEAVPLKHRSTKNLDKRYNSYHNKTTV